MFVKAVGVELTERQLVVLSRIAKRQGRSRASLIREAINRTFLPEVFL